MKALVKTMRLSDNLTILADDKKKSLTVNDKLVKFSTQDFIGRICIITSKWNSHYNNASIIDGERFIVKISDNKTTRTFTGKNAFPPNYREFRQLIAEVLASCN